MIGPCLACHARAVLPEWGDGRCLSCLSAGRLPDGTTEQVHGDGGGEMTDTQEEIAELFAEASLGYGESRMWWTGHYEVSVTRSLAPKEERRSVRRTLLRAVAGIKIPKRAQERVSRVKQKRGLQSAIKAAAYYAKIG